MKDFGEVVVFVGVLLLGFVLWALAMAMPDRPHHQPSGPIGLLWHTATPITDWTPHTSTVLH